MKYARPDEQGHIYTWRYCCQCKRSTKYAHVVGNGVERCPECGNEQTVERTKRDDQERGSPRNIPLE